MNIYAFACLVILTTAAYFFAAGTITFIQRRRWRRRIRAEATRAHFAETRNILMKLARDGKIDTHSRYFSMFYRVSTFVMRRPDEYEIIGQAILQMEYSSRLIGEKSAPDNTGVKEEWPDEAIVIADRILDGMDRLMIDCSFPLRLIASLEKASGGSKAKAVYAFLDAVAAKERRRKRKLSMLADAKDQISQMVRPKTPATV